MYYLDVQLLNIRVKWHLNIESDSIYSLKRKSGSSYIYTEKISVIPRWLIPKILEDECRIECRLLRNNTLYTGDKYEGTIHGDE